MSLSKDRPSTAEAARGRWREILPALGVASTALNGKHQACPACGGQDRFRFDDRNGDGDYYCAQCGAGKGLKLLMNVNGWDYAEAAAKVDELIGKLPANAPQRQEPQAKVDYKAMLRKLADMSQAISAGDPVNRYLFQRRIVGPYPKVLRYVPQMWHAPSSSRHPGMIAIISDAQGKNALLHRTYLSANGSKASVTPVRMLMPGEFPTGGAIRLGPPAEVLGVAEGIETAMSASYLFHMPVWSTVAEGFLRAFIPPPETKRLVIFSDNDPNFVGQSAAYDLAKRTVRDLKINVEVKVPERTCWDWNDELLGSRGIELGNAA